MEIIKYCKKHGDTPHVREGDRWRCKKCRVEAVQKRRQILKLKAIEYKGGKCCICGYNKCMDALDFHHLNENKKSFGVAEKGYTRSWEKVKEELDKCILVCTNCHREIHVGLHIL